MSLLYYYSERYEDATYEYRHVIVKDNSKLSMIPRHRLMNEQEWRSVGICMSRNWVHYGTDKSEQGVLLFRRRLGQ